MPTFFKRRIRRSGGGAVISLPSEILESLGWKEGTDVVVYQSDTGITIEKPKTQN